MVALPSGWKYRNFWQMNSLRPRMSNGDDPGDCGPSACLEALDIASSGEFDTGMRPYPGTLRKRADMIALVRKRGGMPTVGGTSVKENIKAFKSFGPGFAAVNRAAPTCVGLQPGSFNGDLVPALQAGKHAMVAVGYAPIDNYQNHSISGMWGFTHGHMIVVGDYQVIAGVEWIMASLDPLADGRLSGSCGCVVAKGVQQVPLNVIRNATALYTNEGAGSGLVSGMIFTVKALLNPGPPPPPTQGPNDVVGIGTGATPTITTGAAHGLTTGDYVVFSGTNSTPTLNAAYYLVTVLTATTFRVTATITVAGTAGTWADASGPPIGGGTEIPVDVCDLPASQPA